MKINNLLPLLLLLISFTSCVKRTETYNIAPNFSIAEETLRSRIAQIIPAETIYFTTTHTEISGGQDFKTLNVEILADRLPSNGPSFSRLADDIGEAVESGIRDPEGYKNIIIEVRLIKDESGVKYHRSYKKEINL